MMVSGENSKAANMTFLTCQISVPGSETNFVQSLLPVTNVCVCYKSPVNRSAERASAEWCRPSNGVIVPPPLEDSLPALERLAAAVSEWTRPTEQLWARNSLAAVARLDISLAACRRLCGASNSIQQVTAGPGIGSREAAAARSLLSHIATAISA